jgi:fused signal recognition particle receptor
MVRRNEVETRFTADVDEASFKQAEKQLTSSQRRVKQAQEADIAFSRASKDVALAGDVESNIRTLGGAIGAMGGEAGRATEGIIAIGAEFPAVVEAAGRLPAALKGFPASMQAAVTAITGMEVSVAALSIAAGVFVVAAAAAAFALKGLSDASNEAADKVDAQRTANDRYLESLSMTSDQIDEQIRLNEEALETNRKKQEFEKQIIEENKSEGIIEQIGDALGIVGATGDQATDSLKKLEQEEAELLATNEALAKSMNSSEVAANDAAEAQKEQAIASEEAAKAQEKQADATKEVKKTSDEAAKKIADSDKKISDIRGRIFSEIEQQGLAEANARREAAMKITEFQAGNLQKRGQILKDFNRSVIEAELKAAKDRRNLADEQDFRALFDLEETQAEEAEARKRDRDQRLDDLQDSIKTERKKLLEETRMKAKAGSTQVANLTQQLNAEIKNRNEAAKAIVQTEVAKAEAVLDINKKMADATITTTGGRD